MSFLTKKTQITFEAKFSEFNEYHHCVLHTLFCHIQKKLLEYQMKLFWLFVLVCAIDLDMKNEHKSLNKAPRHLKSMPMFIYQGQAL